MRTVDERRKPEPDARGDRQRQARRADREARQCRADELEPQQRGDRGNREGLLLAQQALARGEYEQQRCRCECRFGSDHRCERERHERNPARRFVDLAVGVVGEGEQPDGRDPRDGGERGRRGAEALDLTNREQRHADHETEETVFEGPRAAEHRQRDHECGRACHRHDAMVDRGGKSANAPSAHTVVTRLGSVLNTTPIRAERRARDRHRVHGRGGDRGKNPSEGGGHRERRMRAFHDRSPQGPGELVAADAGDEPADRHQDRGDHDCGGPPFAVDDDQHGGERGDGRRYRGERFGDDAGHLGGLAPEHIAPRKEHGELHGHEQRRCSEDLHHVGDGRRIPCCDPLRDERADGEQCERRFVAAPRGVGNDARARADPPQPPRTRAARPRRRFLRPHRARSRGSASPA